MQTNLGSSWRRLLDDELRNPYFESLCDFVVSERARHEVFPAESDVFRALTLTEVEQIGVVILGQDPYHDVGQAHGLAFSVPAGVKIPPSLRNIYKELTEDLGCESPTSGDLTHWAKQGVLLLNTVLTVRAHEPHSHRRQGWERLTDAIVRQLSASNEHLVFMLWGKPALEKRAMIDEQRHLVIHSAHPSPLSARRGFFGSKPFSRANEWRAQHQLRPIDW